MDLDPRATKIEFLSHLIAPVFIKRNSFSNLYMGRRVVLMEDLKLQDE